VSAIADVEVWSGKDRQDENFPVGSFLIRRELRPHVHAYYAFARNADDIADSPSLSPDDKISRLDIMEDVLTGRREAGSGSALQLRKSLAQTAVTPEHATDLLIAFRRDAVKKRYETMGELQDYCRYSAMPVGRYVLDLHGEAKACYESSDALCTALQILNHLQDCAADLKNLDRCYLPQEYLDKYQARVSDLEAPAETPGLRGTFDLLLRQVDQLTTVSSALPLTARTRSLKVETGAIHNLACRLAARLSKGDPIATRVKLTKMDFLMSLCSALRYAV
jgi:hydroxysqualene synthase